MKLKKLKHYLNPIDVDRIDEMFFDLHDPDFFISSSATEVFSLDTVDEDGDPIPMGLMDPRMGVFGNNHKCKTCGKNEIEGCQGHFGYVNLAVDVYHPFYYGEIKDFLEIYCFECSRPLIGSDRLRKYNDLLLSKRDVDDGQSVIYEVLKKSKNVKKCPYCGEPHDNFKFSKPFIYANSYGRITPSAVKYFLAEINKEDYFNFNESKNVEWMVLSVIPVAPVQMRPFYYNDEGEIVDDGLTVKLKDFVKLNQQVNELLSNVSPNLIIDHEWKQLQKKVDSLYRSLRYRVNKSKERFSRVVWSSSILNGFVSSRVEVRGLSAIIAGYIPFANRDQIIDKLIELCWDEDGNVQIAAIKAMSYLKSERAFSPLKKLLNQTQNVDVKNQLLFYFNTIDNDITVPLDLSDNFIKESAVHVLKYLKSMSKDEVNHITRQMDQVEYESVSDEVFYEKLLHHLLFLRKNEMKNEQIKKDIISNEKKMNRLTDLFIEGRILDSDYTEMMEILLKDNAVKRKDIKKKLTVF